jgi:hypothetical protein
MTGEREFMGSKRGREGEVRGGEGVRSAHTRAQSAKLWSRLLD